MKILIIIIKGGPGSGHHGHSGRPGKRGGSTPSGGGSSIPTPTPSEKDIKEFLSKDTPAHMYHIADYDDMGSIAENGLIPQDDPTGQDWSAEHSEYATYFHGSTVGASTNITQVEELVGYKPLMVVAVPDRTRDLATRILPDEDSGVSINNGLRDYNVNRASIAVIGGLPKDDLVFVYDPGAPDIAEQLSRVADAGGMAVTYSMWVNAIQYDFDVDDDIMELD